MWYHNWVDAELEQKFKRTEKRLVSLGGTAIYPLALDVFKQDLKALGAIGWESVHVDFGRVGIIYEDAFGRKTRLGEKA